MAVHLIIEKEGKKKAKCGSTPWGRFALQFEATSDPQKVTCKRCSGQVQRKTLPTTIKEQMVGKVFHSQFGYDMTINEYAKVIKQSPKSVLLRECLAIVTDDCGRGNGRARAGSLKKDGQIFRLTRMKNNSFGKPYEYWAGGWHSSQSWSEWNGQSNYHNTWD